ncbi:MAG: PD-(D/E)XK motif protein [Alphaproteobacteria bacterium]
MAAPSDRGSLLAVWRALANDQYGEGWRTIPISIRAPCTLFAGRRMPNGDEAVLIGFRTHVTISDAHLPQGQGFEVIRLKIDPTGDDQLILALARRTGASLEFFGMMADDLVNLVDCWTTNEEVGLLQRFLGRIRAWQDFMDRRKEGVLSEEAEQGLFGELVELNRMIETGFPKKSVLGAWQGPVDGLHDFTLGDGSIEVKTTLSVGIFPATISSLEQLDENLRQPLFIAAVRLALDSSGITLPSMANIIREKLQDDMASLELFEVCLIQAGLLPTALTNYTRRFLHITSSIFEVRGDFPRLTHANVCPAIRRAHYEVDLSLAGATDLDLNNVLNLLGA